MSIIKGALNPVVTGSATFSGNTSVAQLAATSSTLNAFAASISTTAVDVLVYDTRKDSDGGAWRKRCQHTSWYNETLNTSTRGSRRDFPAVAVIVATANDITIYDGDSPDLPMWMVFGTTSSGCMLRSGLITSIAMLNGELWVGHGSGSALHWINFLKDTARWITGSVSYGGLFQGGNISNRNWNGSNYLNNVSGASDVVIISSSINDVAMTVIANSPTDAATGLPVPTVAIATNSGVSVIKNDGTVVNVTAASGSSYNYTPSVDITSDGYLVFPQDSSATSERGTFSIPIPTSSRTVVTDSSDITDKIVHYSGATGNYPKLLGAISNVVRNKNTAEQYIWDKTAVTNAGLNVVTEYGAPGANMVRYVTSKFNTGWMLGNTKGSWLSDSTTETLTGVDLVTDGGFETAVNFTQIESNASVTRSATAAKNGGYGVIVTSTGGSSVYAARQITGLTVGKTYTFSVDFNNLNHVTLVNLKTEFGTSGTTISSGGGAASPSWQTFSVTFVATQTYYWCNFFAQGTIYVDNMSLRLVLDSDRSVAATGLQVYGSITKSAASTGTDLVAYSGFSTTNYLYQPYNSSLDIGTGDFCLSGWMYCTDNSGYNMIFSRSDDQGSTQIQLLAFAGQWRFITGTVSTIAGAVQTNMWNHFVHMRKSGTHYLYVNGIYIASAAASASVSGQAQSLAIGNTSQPGGLSTQAFKGKLALIRFGATAPTVDQIVKMYGDEKVMFQDNAKSLLFGTSDVINSVAYDDSTNLLHVGTSSGRSVFQALRRVDNTSTAVSTSISASNGVVAEQ